MIKSYILPSVHIRFTKFFFYLDVRCFRTRRGEQRSPLSKVAESRDLDDTTCRSGAVYRACW